MVQIIELKHLNTHALASHKQEVGPKLMRILNCLFFFEKKKRVFETKKREIAKESNIFSSICTLTDDEQALKVKEFSAVTEE